MAYFQDYSSGYVREKLCSSCGCDWADYWEKYGTGIPNWGTIRAGVNPSSKEREKTSNR